MGTVGYMSPEQVQAASPSITARTSSPSGRSSTSCCPAARAFKRDTSAETIVAILTHEPPELAETGRQVPVALDHIVRHCLEKDPGNRFQSAKDVAFALSEASGPTTATTTTSGVHAVAAPSRRRRRRML